ncbi:MAG: type II toxin-antitoxin system RelE/ParE family toxin [Terrimicrobiaceae bacterium]
MRKIAVLDEAAEDIERGRDFYDMQESGVGDYFADSIVADIECLGLFHGIHSKHFGFYRMLSERFPFGIYYRELSDVTEVFAILDLRKDPAWIHEELTERKS